MSKTASRVRLTVGRVEAFECAAGKAQSFLWDTDAPALMLRATPTGRKTYAFEGRLNGQTIRIGIGGAADWSLDLARKRAVELKQMVDRGIDPRDVERKAQSDRVAAKAAELAKIESEKQAALTVGQVWALYLDARRPFWGDLHYEDHVKLVRAGGVKATRGTGGRGVTIDMPLYPLMALPLRDLTSDVVEGWAKEQAKTRPTSARLAWRLLKVFLNWCEEQPQYAGLLPGRNAAATRKAREALGKPQAKKDVLLREQLPAWFSAVRQLENPTISAYLQTMLLTGARPGEILTMRWDCINTKWRGVTIRDKYEGEREMPLTPYVEQLLSALPRRNEWVFASLRTVSMDKKNIHRRASRAMATNAEIPLGDVLQNSATGHITEPRSHHACACRVAGLGKLTLNGLRRSFKSLTEWMEVPVGVVAQIQGHKPSATAEKHYTRRPLDMLRLHHERIEAWILEQAGVQFVQPAELGRPNLVAV